MSHARLSRPCRVAGFSLVELLVVVGMIALLIGLLMPVVGRARASARDARSMSNLRQLMLGYTMYHQQNRGWLLFGYTKPTVNGGKVVVGDPRSGQEFEAPVADRYPWRLLPNVGNIWDVIHSHDGVPSIPAGGDSPADAFSKAYDLGNNPTYGINAIFVGGSYLCDGFVGGPANDRPNAGKHIVFMANEVRRPTQLIVFADCQAVNNPELVGKGLHHLTPPRADGQKWTVLPGGEFQPLTNAVMGIPKGWHTRRTVTAFFDGHVEAMLPADLEDMRLWANRATSKTYDYQYSRQASQPAKP